MTALDAVSWVDGKQHNVFSLTDKLLWLSQVEAEVRALWSRCGKNVPPEDMKADTVLLIPKPYEGIYTHYLEAQMHYANQEYLKFTMPWGCLRRCGRNTPTPSAGMPPGAGGENSFKEGWGCRFPP